MTKMPSVNNIRRLSSGILKMLWKLFSKLYHLVFPTSRFDLLYGFLAESMSSNSQRNRKFSTTQNFYRNPFLPHQPLGPENLRSHGAFCCEDAELSEIHHLIGIFEKIGEPSLGNPSLQGHLTAFKPWRSSRPRTCLLTLETSTAISSMSRARATAHSFPFFSRSRRWR